MTTVIPGLRRCLNWQLPLLIAIAGCHSLPGATLAPPHGLPGPRLVAEGWILDHTYTNGYRSRHVFLPVTLRGHATTALLDLGTGLTLVDSRVLARKGATHSWNVTPDDSVQIGSDRVPLRPMTAFQNMDEVFATMVLPNHAPATLLLGTAVLERYDLVIDEPHGRIRLYAQPALSSAAPSADTSSGHIHASLSEPPWLPPGLTPADCVPLSEGQFEGMIVVPLQVKGQSLRGFFDSGSWHDVMDMASAQSIGITEQSPGVHRLPADSVTLGPGSHIGDSASTANPEYLWQGVTLTAGHQQLRNQAVHLLTPPNPANRGWLTLGLDAFRDQLVFISYSTGQFCLAPSGAGA